MFQVTLNPIKSELVDECLFELFRKYRQLSGKHLRVQNFLCFIQHLSYVKVNPEFLQRLIKVSAIGNSQINWWSVGLH